MKNHFKGMSDEQIAEKKSQFKRWAMHSNHYQYKTGPRDCSFHAGKITVGHNV